MLPKAIAYVKRNDGETKWMNFLLKMTSHYKHITVFGIDSGIVLKRA